MKAVSHEEAGVLRNHLGLVESAEALDHHYYHWGSAGYEEGIFGVPACLSRIVLSHGPAIFYIRAMDIWRDMDHFMINAIGEAVAKTVLTNNQFLLVDSNEGDALASLIHLAMISGWDCEIYSTSTVKRCEIDHDGNLDLYSIGDRAIIVDEFKKMTGRELRSISQ